MRRLIPVIYLVLNGWACRSVPPAPPEYPSVPPEEPPIDLSLEPMDDAASEGEAPGADPSEGDADQPEAAPSG